MIRNREHKCIDHNQAQLPSSVK